MILKNTPIFEQGILKSEESGMKIQDITGYPSIDKPWLKYYTKEAIDSKIPQCSVYDYLFENNKNYPTDVAINYFGTRITYGELFELINKAAKAFIAQGVKAGDVVTIVTLSCVQSVVCFYALNKIGAISNYVNVLSSEEDLKKYLNEAKSQVVVGIPLVKNNLMIWDVDLKKELKYGETGEVCLQCESQMISYMDNDEEMNNLFHTHKDGSKWLHTGDLGYVDSDGFLYLVGRMKRIILTSKDGVVYKVFPNISEEVIASNKDIQDICIVGFEENNDIVLKAYVVLKKERRNKWNEIERQLRVIAEKELSEHMRPTYYELREKLPLTSAGKIDYRKLEEETQ